MNTAPADDIPIAAPHTQNGQVDVDHTIVCVPPIILRAQSILRQRLGIFAEHVYTLDGAPASVRDIIVAANKFIMRFGGTLLAYPGMHSRYDRDAPQMRIRQLSL